MKAKRIKI